MRVLRSIFLVCTVCLSFIFVHAQSAPAATPVPQPDASQPAQALTANLGNEPVGVGDLVYISVTGAPELTRSYRVAKDGRLSLPLVHEPISVVGMVPAAIARAVTDALIRDRILVAPIVSAAVLEYRSRQVTVTGAVKSPTVMPAIGDLKLLDAITRAQGLAAEAGPEVIVTRPADASGSKDTIRIPTKELLSGKNPALNVALHGGEEIRVPDAPKLFVVGNVKSPGIYRINDAEGSSVFKAMAMSQGPLTSTNKEAYVYRVVEGTDERKEIAIPLRDILKRKRPDVQLQANDILYVPQNTKLQFSKILEHMAGLGESVGSGLITAHPF